MNENSGFSEDNPQLQKEASGEVQFNRSDTVWVGDQEVDRALALRHGWINEAGKVPQVQQREQPKAQPKVERTPLPAEGRNALSRISKSLGAESTDTIIHKLVAKGELSLSDVDAFREDTTMSHEALQRDTSVIMDSVHEQAVSAIAAAGNINIQDAHAIYSKKAQERGDEYQNAVRMQLMNNDLSYWRKFGQQLAKDVYDKREHQNLSQFGASNPNDLVMVTDGVSTVQVSRARARELGGLVKIIS